MNFVFVFFLLDFLSFEKVWFWDSHGLMKYVHILSFLGDFGTTVVTKKAMSRTRKIFISVTHTIV